jgi:hypothetical protein
MTTMPLTKAVLPAVKVKSRVLFVLPVNTTSGVTKSVPSPRAGVRVAVGVGLTDQVGVMVPVAVGEPVGVRVKVGEGLMVRVKDGVRV